MKIVNRYIGVTGGYLGDFSYRTHADFYPEYCNLDINPHPLEGTTRERFIEILKISSPDVQANIVRGVLERFPIVAENKPATRTQELFDELIEIARRLEGASPIATPDPKTTSVIVERAISDVEALLQSNGAISGVDRIHTALHGYLQAVCDSEKITYAKDDSMAKLFKSLRQSHPALQNLGSRSQDIERVFQSFASVLDALNPIRNNASVAHPNNDLLEKDEAMLVINAARTLWHYLDAKFG
ncbi:MAG: abortive infection family protein [Anaerolineales bacterium]|nr:abortive infection family protein [Anaerolineales bacterium]